MCIRDSSLSEEQKQQAAELVRKERVSVTLKENVEKIYIAVKVYGQNHCAEAVIEGQHTCLLYTSHERSTGGNEGSD